MQITPEKSNDPLKARRIAIVFSLLLSIIYTRSTAQTSLGPFTGYHIDGMVVTVFAGESSVRFQFREVDLLRVDFLPESSSRPDSSFAVLPDSTTVSCAVVDSDSTLEIIGPGISVTCLKYPLRFRYRDAAGTILVAEPASGGLGTLGAQRWAVFSLPPDEHFHGTGARSLGLDLRGRTFESYNTQLYGYSGPVPTGNINVPLLLSSRGYGILFDNTWRGRFNLGASDPGRFHYVAEGGELTFYLIRGGSVEQALERYTLLTGRQALPPRWSFGYLQSKFGYRTEQEARTVVGTFRSLRIPCDAIILDLYWFRNMGDLQWDNAAWPSPFLMMADFLAAGMRTVTITEPYVVEHSPTFSIAAANGYFARTIAGLPFILPSWWSCNCNAGLVDMTDPAARSWWWSLHPSFMGNHVAGLWTDLGEPERHPDGMQHTLGPAARVHNIYNLLWAATLADGYAQTAPDRRLFTLTRSGFAGIQRFGVVTWSGDVAKSFGGLAVQVPMMLNTGLSGLAYHHSDIGGFCCGTTTPELYIRWLQFGTFSPIMRAHGALQATEPWAFGPEAEAVARRFIGLRYRLLPYLYSLAHVHRLTGVPFARPLFFAEPANAGLRDESRAYLFGDAFLVAPVVEEARRTQDVPLPSGEWVDYWTDGTVAGGSVVSVPAPLDRIPLFVRAGSIIPMAPPMQWSDERPRDTLLLALYPGGSARTTFTLYEDDGITRAYERGEVSATPLEQEMVAGDSGLSVIVRIGPTNGTHAGRLSRRTVLAEIHRVPAAPTAVHRNGRNLELHESYDSLRRAPDGYYYDAASRLLFIQTPVDDDSLCVLEAADILPTGATGRERDDDHSARLLQNHPNPFNPLTTITFVIPPGTHEEGTFQRTSLRVFDLLGREVATLLDARMSPGTHDISFDASQLPSGTYLYRLTSGRFSAVRKMVLVR